MIDVADFIAEKEGYEPSVYICTEGYPTIGYGKRLGPKMDLKTAQAFYTFEIPEEIARAWMLIDIDQVINHPRIKSLIGSVSGKRKVALISMAYQLGPTGLCKFKRMIAAINAGEWDEAYEEALDSKWARQTPNRAKETAEMIRDGGW